MKKYISNSQYPNKNQHNSDDSPHNNEKAHESIETKISSNQTVQKQLLINKAI